MIPIAEEQSSGREPFLNVKIGWGGDLALSAGLVGCTATASTSAAGYPATNVNDGDRTLLNASWWESTKVDGKAFDIITDGKIFEELFDDFTNWSSELTDGTATSASSTADNPWAILEVESSSPGTAAYVFRRTTASYSFTSERIFGFTLDLPVSRSYSDTNTHDISLVLCPTSVSTTPYGESNWLFCRLVAKNEGIVLEVYKNIAGSSTLLYSTSELTTTKKRMSFRMTIDSTTLSVWCDDLGLIVDNVTHGLSFTSAYLYTQLRNFSGDIRKGSVGYIRVYRGTTQTIQGLDDGTKVELKGTDFQNGDFSKSANFATQEFIEDFEEYSVDDNPSEWIINDDGGTSSLLVKNDWGSKAAKIENDSPAVTWAQLTQRTFYDFEYNSTILLPNRTAQTLQSINFEDRTVGDNLTSYGWTYTQYGTDTSTYTVVTGKYASVAVTGGAWAGGYDLTASSSYVDYKVDFDIKATAGGRTIAGVRASGSGAYWIQWLPSSELRLMYSSGKDFITGNTVIANWDGQSPASASNMTIQVEHTASGEKISLWIDGGYINAHTDNTYNLTSGGFIVSGFLGGWQLDNVVITEVITNLKFSQLIRCATDFSNAYHLKHDPLNNQFTLVKGAANVTGGTVLVTTAYTYPTTSNIHVRCLALDNVIQVWLDGTQVCNYTDGASPIYEGKLGLQLDANVSYSGYIDNMVSHINTLPSYWRSYNDNCGLVLQQQNNFTILYPERYNARTSTDATDFSWVDISDATSQTDGQMFGENHRGGYLSSDCSSNGTVAGSSSTAVQEVDVTFQLSSAFGGQTATVAVRHIKDSDGGEYDIEIGGSKVGSTVDSYSASKTYEWVVVGTHTFSGGGPSSGGTLTIKKLGTKNASSTDYWARVLEVGIFLDSSDIPTDNETLAFSNSAFTSDHPSVLLATNTVREGQECGIRQNVTFPKGQEVTIQARVIVPAGGMGAKMVLGESVTNTGTEFTLSSHLTEYTLSITRTNLEGDSGDIYLYISDTGSKQLAKVYVKEIAVLGADGVSAVTHVKAPYTTSSPALTGTAPEFILSNILLSSEDFQAPEWSIFGDVTILSDNYLNPIEGGTNGSKITFSDSTSYIYQDIPVNHANRSFTLSVWLRADAATSIYLGLLENEIEAESTHFELKDVTTEWQRFTFILNKDDMENTSISDRLYFYLGTYGLGSESDLTSRTVYAWGAQVVESEGDISFYTKRDETNLISGSSVFPTSTTFLTNSIVWTQDFEALSVGTDLTTVDWTLRNVGAASPTFEVVNGKFGEGQVESATQASYQYSEASALLWTDYEFTFNLERQISNVQALGMNFRWTSSGGYSLEYYPSSGQLRLYVSANVNLVTGRSLVANWDASIPSEINTARLVIKGTTFEFYADDILIGTYTGLTHATGSVGFTFGYTDDTAGEGIVVDNLKVNTYDIATQTSLAAAGTTIVSDSDNTGVVLTGREFTGSVYLRAYKGEGDVYVIVDDGVYTQYSITKVSLTKDWKKVHLNNTFTATASTTVRVSVSIAAIGGYGALADIDIECINGAIYEIDSTDHAEIWEGTTNILPYSEDFSNATWTKDASITITADQFPNPVTFELNADKISAAANNQTVYRTDASTPPDGSTPYTFSVWLRSDQQTAVELELNSTTPHLESITVNPYWEKFSFTYTLESNATFNSIIRIVNSGDYIYAWGAQTETKDYVTKYETTGATAVTRNDTRLAYTTPTALSGEDKDWTITMKFNLLADAYDSTTHHNLLTLGAYSTVADNTARLYLDDSKIKLDIQDTNSVVSSAELDLPDTLELDTEYQLSLVREGNSWSIVFRDTVSSAISGFNSDTGFEFPTTYYVGSLDDNSEHGNIRVSDVIIWNNNLADNDTLALASDFLNYSYDLVNTIHTVIPFVDSTDSYRSGGSVVFDIDISTQYPLAIEWNLWEYTQQRLLDSSYSVTGGTIWEWDPDWVILTFDSEVEFNRVKLFSYPNSDSSLNIPYTAGRGGLKDWTLEYWSDTAEDWILFYRKTGSTTDLDIVNLNQLCTNGIFEDSGSSDWKVTNSDYVTIAQDDTTYLTGLHSLSVSVSGALATGEGAKFNPIFTPGVTYTVSGWVQGSTGSVVLDVYDGSTITSSTAISLSSTWQYLTVTFTTASDAEIGSSYIQFVTASTVDIDFNIDEISIVPSEEVTITTDKIRLVVHDLQVEGDTSRVVSLEVYNYHDESANIDGNNVTVTYRKTPDTNSISPGEFSVTLSNLDERYTPKNSSSPIYGISQADGRGFVRAGTTIEISGGYENSEGIRFSAPIMLGTIGSEKNPAANTGIEVDSSNQTVTLVGGDNLVSLERTMISDSNVLDGLTYEDILTYLCQVGGFAIQEMQFDESGTTVPFSWFGNNASALSYINKILEASYGVFFSHPGQKRRLFFYDGVKFKSWLQTTKSDFDAGVSTNVTTSESPGNVELILTGGDWDFRTETASLTDVYNRYYENKLILFDSTYTAIGILDHNVKDYHFEETPTDNWVITLSDGASYSQYTDGDYSLGYLNRMAVNSADGASSTSILKIDNLDLGTSPKLSYEVVDEDDNVLLSDNVRIFNSSIGYEVVGDLDDGVIPNPSTASTVASYTIRFTVSDAITVGGYVYIYFPSKTTVANGSWGVPAGGPAIAGITLDGVNRFGWFATEAAYTKLSMRIATPGTGITLSPGVHELVIDSSVVNTITNPATNGYNYKLYLATSQDGTNLIENYIWSNTYSIGYDNGLPSGTYYFARRREYTYADDGNSGQGLLQGRSDAFVVPAGKRRIPYLTNSGGSRSDTFRKFDSLYMVQNPADPDNTVYNWSRYTLPGDAGHIDGVAASSWKDLNYTPGVPIPPFSETLTGWSKVTIPLYSSIDMHSPDKIKLRLIFKGTNGNTIVETKDPYFTYRDRPYFEIYVAQLDDTILLDSVKYGALKVPISGDVISDGQDTTDTAPIWGDVSIDLDRNLNYYKGENVRVYSQTSDDNITWYGQGGVGVWDYLGYMGAGSASFDITSPSKRYIRFKLELHTGDQSFTPVISSVTFSYTKDGNLVSQVLDATSDLTKWGVFDTNYTTETGITDVTYETLSSDDSGFTQLDPAGWVAATPGSLITSAVKRYIKWRSNLTSIDGDKTPSVHDVTINWEKGLDIPSELRSYSYDNRLLEFTPRSGFPRCNKAEALANFYTIDPSIVAANVTAYWNGSGSSAKLCGEEVASYPELPLSVDSTTKTVILEATNPTITPNVSTYSSYLRAFAVTIGGTNYGVYGYDSGVQEGVEFSFLAGALKLTFEGTGKRITCTIETTTSTSITDFKIYGYSIKKVGNQEPPLLVVQEHEDTVSENLYNQLFLKQINNEYITSETAALNLAELVVDDGKYVRDYGTIRIPIAFSTNLQTKVIVSQDNAGWDNQFSEAYEIMHDGSNWTTTITIQEK